MVLESGKVSASMYGIPYQTSPQPNKWIEADHTMGLDGEEWILLSSPGHSPASMVFYLPSAGFAIPGAVWFRDSIERNAFPGGNKKTRLRKNNEKQKQ